MDCPACHSALVAVERHAIEVDWCPECQGLWFDEGELELLGEKTGWVPDVADLGRRPGQTVERGSRRCPRCPRKMDRVGIPRAGSAPVQVDRCPGHGIWLDRGELAAIVTLRDADPDRTPVLGFLGETFEAAHARASSERRDS